MIENLPLKSEKFGLTLSLSSNKSSSLIKSLSPSDSFQTLATVSPTMSFIRPNDNLTDDPISYVGFSATMSIKI